MTEAARFKCRLVVPKAVVSVAFHSEHVKFLMDASGLPGISATRDLLASENENVNICLIRTGITLSGGHFEKCGLSAVHTANETKHENG